MNTSFTYVLLCGMFLLYSLELSFASTVLTAKFNRDFYVAWAPSHVTTSPSGHTRFLRLDKDSGSGCKSNDAFLFGQFDMRMKLVPGDSAGTVMTFYLVSDQDQKKKDQDELDFEFLGNILGQPYNLQTNVFVGGVGFREMKTHLWFDPTVDFHKYSVLWNIHQIVFMVDSIPIRTYRNHADKGVPYPQGKPMKIDMSLWDGSKWATGGGKYKVDWTKAPFIGTYRDYKIDACVPPVNAELCRSNGTGNWFNNIDTLTPSERKRFKWVRKNFVTYDYCKQPARFNGTVPKECHLPYY